MEFWFILLIMNKLMQNLKKRSKLICSCGCILRDFFFHNPPLVLFTFSFPYSIEKIRVMFLNWAKISSGFSYHQILEFIDLLIFVIFFFTVSVLGLQCVLLMKQTWVKDAFIQYGSIPFFFFLHWLLLNFTSFFFLVNFSFYSNCWSYI